MQFISAIAAYTEQVPFTGDVNKIKTSAVVPSWFTQSTMHVAKVIRVGPFSDPDGFFVVGASQLMVEFEAPQPPVGSLQAIENPRPHWYAILGIDRTFVAANTNLFCLLDPNASYVPGDKVSVWFSITSPASIIGKYRPSSGAGKADPKNSPMPGMFGW